MGKGGGGASGPSAAERLAMIQAQREAAAEQMRLNEAAQIAAEGRLREQKREDRLEEEQRLLRASSLQASKAKELSRREDSAAQEIYGTGGKPKDPSVARPDISAPTIESPDYGSTENRPL